MAAPTTRTSPKYGPPSFLSAQCCPRWVEGRDSPDPFGPGIAITRDELWPLIKSMPDVVTTAKQRDLERKHGTPFKFAQACVAAFVDMDITAKEAKKAIRKYAREWENA